jgi:hypothetical protein
MNDSSHIISIEESQWSLDTTFLLTPSIQYNKFEAVEELKNESGSDDVEKYPNDHSGVCLRSHLWCGSHRLQDRHPPDPWYH